MLTLTLPQLDIENRTMEHAFKHILSSSKYSNDNSSVSGVAAVQQILVSDMMSIDRGRTKTTLSAWNEFLQKAAGRQHHVTYCKLDDYIPYRILDSGQM